MCWACYTPLSGGAAAAPGPAGAAKGSAPAASGDAGEKKKIPPWQMGVLGVGALALVYVGAKTFMPSSSGGGDDDDDDPAKTEEKKNEGGDAPAPAGPAPSISNPVVINATTGTAQVMPQKAPFTIVVPPNPKLSVATMAIVPTESGTSGPQAAALAAYTRRQYTARVKNWDTLYIYVFSDAQSAQSFADFQMKRKGAALGEGDFGSLTTIWSTCLARYEYSNTGSKKIERVLYPSRNPGGWWYGR